MLLPLTPTVLFFRGVTVATPLQHKHAGLSTPV
jgi:hypothetical protein